MNYYFNAMYIFIFEPSDIIAVIFVKIEIINVMKSIVEELSVLIAAAL